MRLRSGLRALALWAVAAPAAAAPPSLSLPVDCTLGEDCFIQQYVDFDPGPAARDFTCGPLSYDGHKGTDFALPDRAALAREVAVRAAAPGTVTATRDDMPDIQANDPGAPDLSGRDCGNGVVIDHGDGWETQYCHMARGSIAVETGATVQAGTRLGTIGLSGNTEFPHLHLSVRRDDETIDPFAPEATACGAAPDATLWADPLPYQPGTLASAGFAADIPAFDAILAGTAGATRLDADGPALVIWAQVAGGRAGDILRLSVTGPAGEEIAADMTLDRDQARLFRATGRRTPPEGWAPGTYRGQAELRRGDTVIDRAETEITLD